MVFKLTKSTKTKKRKRVGCDSCNMLVINNISCHEHGCPKTRKKRKNNV